MLKTSQASEPSGAKPTAADIERRFQLKRWRSTGVWPLGAQVALTEGRSENPDSSWKQTQALLRRALFFHGATPSSPSWRWPRRHALPHGAPGADDSIPPAAGSATRAQGGNRRQSRFRSLPPRAAADRKS